MTKLKNFFIRNRKLFSVFFSVAFSVLVVAVLVHGATTIGLNIDTGRNINASGTLGVGATSTLYGVGADLIVQGVSTSTFAGQLAVSGNFEVGSADASSTLQSTMLSVYYDTVNTVGKFYVDSSGNVSASGTLYGGGNNLADIGAFGTAWKDVYASGTIHGNSISVGAGGLASSTLAGSGTSTFRSDLTLDTSNGGLIAATTTLQVGGYATTTNRGGCIALTAASGTNSGLGTLYLIVQTNTEADSLMFTTSTNASDCY